MTAWLDFLKVMLVLGGVLALAWAALKVLLPQMASLRALRTDLVEVVARTPLEPRKTLYVVRAGNQWLLLGAAGDSLTVLRELPPGDVPAAPAPAAGETFAERLRKLGKGQ